MSTDGLFCGDMVDIGLGDAEATFVSWATADTVAVFIDRREVVCVFLMAKIQAACIHDGIAETLFLCQGSSYVRGNKGLGVHSDLLLSAWATHSRTCLRQERQQRQCLRDIPAPGLDE